MPQNVKLAVSNTEMGKLRREEVPRLSFRSNFSWALFGNVVISGCQWLTLVVLAKLEKVEMIGLYALALAVTTPVSLGLNQGQRTIQVTDVKGKYTFGNYLALRILTVMITILIITGIVSSVRYSRQTSLIIMCVAVAKGVDAIGDVFHSLFQQSERMDLAAKSMFINGLLSLAAMWILVLLTDSMVMGSIGLIGASGATLLAYNIPSAMVVLAPSDSGSLPRFPRLAVGLASITPEWDLRSITELARTFAPLSVAYVISSLTPNIPRYFLESVLGAHALGVFAALAYVMLAGNTVVSALAQSALPRLSVSHLNGDFIEYRRILLKLVGFAICMAFAMIGLARLAGPTMLQLVYTKEYAKHGDLFVLLAAATALGFIIWFLDAGISAARRFPIQLPINVFTLACVFGGSWVFVADYGLRGAALSLIIGMSVQLLLKGLVLRNVFSEMVSNRIKV